MARTRLAQGRLMLPKRRAVGLEGGVTPQRPSPTDRKDLKELNDEQREETESKPAQPPAPATASGDGGQRRRGRRQVPLRPLDGGGWLGSPLHLRRGAQ